MAEIQVSKEFVRIGENAYVALGDAIAKLQHLPDKCVDLIITQVSDLEFKPFAHKP